ncbi:RNA polymerase sigma factor [Nitrospira moscoviensis]|uniref:Putative RNA polymerase sigma factor FecI (Sigma-19) n=1 Tax=Nitrospira moscoviensis TaxID=42253 RepID=A0A0K2G8N7_NITMO|nr:RNA polymerase sigma factor [Nitrospira moscoviensis]ALA57323.1 putative RNA polymerase sigma factor FecI (sigma-19) [Nitrospira moscoviensis]
MHGELLQAFQACAADLRRFFTGRVRCEQMAADLTQEIYLRLARIDQPHLIADLRSYLFRIAANLATDHERARQRRAALVNDEADWLAVPDRAASPEQALLAKEELRLVEEALHELSPLCRRIFFLNRFEGLPHGVIAARLGVCKSTVEKNIARALNHCRERLEDPERRPPSGCRRLIRLFHREDD